MLLRRECRQISLPPIRSRRPLDFLLEDVNLSRKPFIYHGRDIVKENVRTVSFQRPPKLVQRQVPAFSMQSQQKNVIVLPPKRIMRRSKSADNQSEESKRFAVLYGRGDLSVVLEHNGASGEPPRYLRWLRPLRQLSINELSYYLEMFSLGLGTLQQPLRNVSEWGISDLLNAATGFEPVLGSLPHLVRGIRAMLSSVDVSKKLTGLKLMSRISRMVGPSLVPFYRQLLPPLRKVEQTWRGSSHLAIETERILNELERTGGSTAFVNIKYLLPYYESYKPKF